MGGLPVKTGLVPGMLPEACRHPLVKLAQREVGTRRVPGGEWVYVARTFCTGCHQMVDIETVWKRNMLGDDA